MNNLKFAAALSALVGLTSVACGDLADFYIADASGGIHLVDGVTLQATEVIRLENGFSTNEILYLDDGTILTNANGIFVQYDLTTGAENVVFDMRDHFNDSAFYISMGMAATNEGDIYFTTERVSGAGVEWFGGVYDPYTGSYTQVGDIVRPTGLYFDHHEIGENLYLGADFNGDQISVMNTDTGTTEFFDVGYAVVSFFESEGVIYTMSKTGDIYTLDVDTMVSTYYGEIGSQRSDWIGAASTSNPYRLPSPGVLSLFGFAGIAASRRRR